ncbi:MAG: hypothetical protein CL802_13455 [Citromicrobium sp.]|nr:hypothetical protein [Citromicrobium sp.]|tara:strand:- start:8521 stop:11100 length:2580 start_codon:yes stop_codon:yes gene_type:complete
MTVAAGDTPYHSYFPGSAQSAEPIPFQFMALGDLRVQVKDGDTLTEGVHYQLGGNPRLRTATITALIDASAAEWELWSETPPQQELQAKESRALPLDQYETELDRNAVQVREAAFDLKRTPKVARGQTAPAVDMAGLQDGELLRFNKGRIERFDTSKFAGKFFAGNAVGLPVPANGNGGADETLRADLADEDAGSDLVVYKAGPGALFRTVKQTLNDGVRLSDFHLGNGTNADMARLAAIAEANERGLKKIVTPGGRHYLFNRADFPAGFTLEGDGESSRFTVGADNSNTFQISNDDVILKGLLIEGNGTALNSSNGVCLYVTGGGLVVEHVLFSTPGFAGMSGATLTPKRGPKLIGTRHRYTEGGASHCEIFLGGAWLDTKIIDPDWLANSTSVERGLHLFNVNDAVPIGCHIIRPIVKGYGRQGIAFADENWTGENRNFGLVVQGGHIQACKNSAIKAKLSKGILIDDVLIEGCGGVPENGPSGLYGAILLNSIGSMNVTNCRLRDNGTAAIVFNGNDGEASSVGTGPKSRPDGYGLATIKTRGNFIEGTGTDETYGGDYGNGIVALGRIKEISLDDDSLRGIKRYGVQMDGAWRNGIQSVKLNKVTIIDSPSASHYAIYLKNAGIVQQDGCRVHNWSGLCNWYEQVETVIIGPLDSAGDSATAAFGYYFGTGVQNVEFYGRAGNSYYDAHADATGYLEGQRVQVGGNVYQCVIPGTSGTGTPPTGDDGSELLTDGTAKWRYVHKYRANNGGLLFSPGVQTVVVGDSATFPYLVGPAIGGNPPTNLRRSRIASGTVTLSAGSKTVTLPDVEFDTGYRIVLSHNADERIRWASKTPTSFICLSDNPDSTATVDWSISR